MKNEAVSGIRFWKGVVMIERPAQLAPDVPCRVTSARTLALDGKRAIYCKLPYAMFSRYFTAVDGAEVCAYAEFRDGHLEFFERASQREYFLHAADPLTPQ